MRLKRRRCSGPGVFLALFGLAVLPVAGRTGEETPGPDDAYSPGDFGRVRYEENGLSILRSETAAMREFPSTGQVNAPIFPGDIVTTNSEQRGEVQLAEGSLVRIDRDSQVVFLALSDPYTEVPDNTVLQLAEGAIRLETMIDEQEEFRVDTPACTVYLTGDADVRVEVRGERTLVAARRGVAEVDSGKGALVVRGGMATEVSVGRAPQDARPFNTFLADEFDRWVADRAEHLAAESATPSDVADVYEDLPDEVRPYYRELSHHGSWVRNDTFGPIWIPSIAEPGWRPYGHGRWGYGPRGYFWVAHEPWGWAPYHFGRWVWVSGFGWSWIPGSVFGGAWVSWSWGPSHVGWCALDYWNRPARRAAETRGIYDARTWTFISYDNLARVNASAYHVDLDRVANLDQSVVVSRSPRVSPSQLMRAETRAQVIAQARASSVSWVADPGDDDAIARSRPFVELEKRPGLGRTLPPGSEPRAGQQPIAATPVSGTTNAGSSPSGDAAIRGLSGTSRPSASPTQPGLMRPLVHSEQDKLEGASERWKDIYRKMSQPRPTRSQDGREDAEEPAEGTQSDRKAPAKQSKTSRPPGRRDAGNDARAERPPPRAAASGNASPAGTGNARFAAGRASSGTRAAPSVRRGSAAEPQRATGAASRLQSTSRRTPSPSRQTPPERTVSVPKPRPAGAVASSASVTPRSAAPSRSRAKPVASSTRESGRGRKDSQR